MLHISVVNTNKEKTIDFNRGNIRRPHLHEEIYVFSQEFFEHFCALYLNQYPDIFDPHSTDNIRQLKSNFLRVHVHLSFCRISMFPLDGPVFLVFTKGILALFRVFKGFLKWLLPEDIEMKMSKSFSVKRTNSFWKRTWAERRIFRSVRWLSMRRKKSVR